MYFKVLAFLTIVMSCHMASPLSNLQEIRELLEEIRVMQEQVNPLDSAVMDIVEKVYSPDLQTRLTRVKDEEGRDCGEGWTACESYSRMFIYLFGVLRHFQHCTGHITTDSFGGRGNQ